MRLYNALTLSVLLYSSEWWAIKAKTKSRIDVAEMKCMRKSLAYNWTEYKTNTAELYELNIIAVIEKINVH